MSEVHPFRGCRGHRHICMWRLCEEKRPSSRWITADPSPMRELSLHRRNNSVERPWGTLEPVYEQFRKHELKITLSEALVTHTYMYVASLWSRKFPSRWITADPSAWVNFTRTDETTYCHKDAWGIHMMSVVTTSLWLRVNSLIIRNRSWNRHHMYPPGVSVTLGCFVGTSEVPSRGGVRLSELHSYRRNDLVSQRRLGDTYDVCVTTCLWLRVNSLIIRGCSDTDIYVCGVFVK